MTSSAAAKMPWGGKDVPHVVIEVNQKCNISCAACYKDKSNYTKPLEQIKSEVDLAASKRHLSIVTLAGGEPSLHPALPEIISYIASKGLQVQMLSNGFALTDKRLAEYKQAGLDGVFLHIDSQQKRADAPAASCEKELDPLRKTIGQRVSRHGIDCFLECTLYQKNLSELPDVVECVLANPEFRRLLVTCYTDFAGVLPRVTSGEVLGNELAPILKALDLDKLRVQTAADGEQNRVTNAEVIQLLHEKLGMLPFGYIASNKRETEQRWILYYAFVINLPSGEYRVLHSPPSFGKLANLRNARTNKQGKPYTFETRMTGPQLVATCLVQALASLSPSLMVRTARFLANLLKPGARIYYKSFCFQEGPNVTPDGELEYCYDCPDATIRNGQLVPVCMVDYLSPLPQ